MEAATPAWRAWGMESMLLRGLQGGGTRETEGMLWWRGWRCISLRARAVLANQSHAQHGGFCDPKRPYIDRLILPSTYVQVARGARLWRARLSGGRVVWREESM